MTPVQQMQTRPVRKTIQVPGSPETVKHNLAAAFERGGLRSREHDTGTLEFSNPLISPFSSKRPLSCISTLTVDISNGGDTVIVDIGVSFTKIKYFFIAVLMILCVVLPAVISYYQRGAIDIPPPSYLGIPIGFMVHYHVRWRVLHTIRRLILQAGE